jgi:hypothetical protein
MAMKSLSNDHQIDHPYSCMVRGNVYWDPYVRSPRR